MSSKKENDPLLVNSMTQQIKAFLDMHSNGNMNNTLYVEVKTEALRFFAYLFFWIMAIVATLLTEFVVRDRLLAGPEPGEPICPPFDSKHGFDISTDSHLIRVYGFNNVSLSTRKSVIVFSFHHSQNKPNRFVPTGTIHQLEKLWRSFIPFSSTHCCCT